MAGAQNVALRCNQPLEQEAQRVVQIRLGELLERYHMVTGPEDEVRLHDLRIAAKRLRYSLEMFAPCFPASQIKAALGQLKDLQDVLGRIHDLDVLHHLLLQRLDALDQQQRGTLVQIAANLAGEKHEDALRVALDDPSGRACRLGLYTVLARKQAERRDQIAQFQQLWSRWQESGFLDRLEELTAV